LSTGNNGVLSFLFFGASDACLKRRRGVATHIGASPMKIESTDQTIADLLNAGYYVIPRFQRPYSWDQENITEFWDDTVRGSNDDYFIGSMVVYKVADRKYGVVDGQQRLTTITILLCVLRDVLQAEGHGDQAKGLHRLIERENINNEAEFVLQTESSYPYFQEYIQKAEEPELEAEIHREERNLQAAHTLFRALVGQLVAAVKNNPKLTEERVQEVIKRELTSIRDTLLSLKIILIRLDDEDDAYIIFETLNTRGKDLALSDLVKNHFTKLLKAKNKGIDQPKEKWALLRETIEGSRLELDSDTFIHHYWLSKYDYVTAKNLFKAFRKEITKQNVANELQAMFDDAELYRSIHDPDYRKWDKQESEIEGSLRALMLFRVRQQVPCVLSILRAYENNIISKKQLERALIDIEKFHFQFTAITSQRSSGGISGMYASLGRRTYGAGDSQAAANIIGEMRDKLRERVPSEAEFVALFPELIYTNKVSKQRALVKYVLVEFAKHDKMALPADYDDLTIEHIAPQSIVNDAEWTHETVGQLGNLILVTDEINSKLKDKDFKTKKELLKAAGYPLPPDVAGAEAWTPKHIVERTTSLALQAFNVVWKI
jgi:uncharacterized protein with ParB-like and HNH nuclease domain